MSTTSHTRRFVPPISRAKNAPDSVPSGNPITQAGNIGYLLVKSTVDIQCVPLLSTVLLSAAFKNNRPLVNSSTNRSVMAINLSVGTVNNFSNSAICSKRSFGTRAIDPFREAGFLYKSIESNNSFTGRGVISIYEYWEEKDPVSH